MISRASALSVDKGSSRPQRRVACSYPLSSMLNTACAQDI